jgi:predicted anti-sigma-YlaC factor YlaD
MECERYRNALSAGLDGEETGVEPAVLERHLAGCPACRLWANEVATLTRAVRVSSADPIPDLTSAILAAIGRETAQADWREKVRALRIGLAVLAVMQLAMASYDLFLGGSHTLHELGSFDAALAVGFLCAAWRPVRAYGMLPLMGALVAGLGVTTAIDITEGHAVAFTESSHLYELAGFALLWILARAAARPDGGVTSRPRRLLGMA